MLRTTGQVTATTVGWTTLVCAMTALPLIAQTNEPARLDGEWQLIDQLSQGPDPTAWRRGSEGRQTQDTGSFGGGFGGFGRGRGRGGFGSPSYPAARDRRERDDPTEIRAARQAAVTDLTTAPRRMAIVTGRREVELRYADGRVVRLIPDDRDHSGIAGNGMSVKRRTKWSERLLTTRIDLQTRRKFRVRRTYELVPEQDRLVVTSQYEGDHVEDDEDREFRQVYERTSD